MTPRKLRGLALPIMLVTAWPAIAQSGQNMSIDDMERALGLSPAATPAAVPSPAEAPRFRVPSFSFGTSENEAPAANTTAVNSPGPAVAPGRPGMMESPSIKSTDNSFWLPINFAFASSRILPGYAPAITRIAMLMSKHPNLVLEIRGHTDAVGNPMNNLSLSQSRAEAVREALIAQGVDAGRLPTVGVGAKQLLSGIEPTNAKNRRVEFKRVNG